MGRSPDRRGGQVATSFLRKKNMEDTAIWRSPWDRAAIWRLRSARGVFYILWKWDTAIWKSPGGRAAIWRLHSAVGGGGGGLYVILLPHEFREIVYVSPECPGYQRTYKRCAPLF